MKKRLRLIINTVLCVIIALLVLVVIILLIGRANNKVAFILGHANVWILSPSMEPTIEAESYIMIEKVSPEDINKGDVITFYSDDPSLNGNMNTHRVMEIIDNGNGTEYVTMGDGNSGQKDNYTAKPDKVVGRYVKNLPVLTVFMRFFLTTAGLITVIFLIIMLIATVFITDVIKKRKLVKKSVRESDDELMKQMIQAEVEKLKAQDKEKNKQENNSLDRDNKD